MTRQLSIFVYLFCSFIFLGCADSPEAKKETLEVAVRKFNEALMKEDIVLAEKMMTNSYQHLVGAHKTLDKDTLIHFLSKNKERVKSGELSIIRYTMDDIEMDISENTAMVTGRVQVRIKDKEAINNYNYRVQHLWRLEKGSWKRTGFYDPRDSH